MLETAYERQEVDAGAKLVREVRATAESYARVAGRLVEGGENRTLIDARRQSVALLGNLANRLCYGSRPRSAALANRCCRCDQS